jgi:hypothetical protein
MSACRTALAAVLLGVSGLFVTAPGAAGQQEGPQGDGVSLTVRNEANDLVRVYVLQAGHMVPIGTVQASADTTLTIQPSFLESGEEIQLMAEPVGGTTFYRSDPVAVRASSRVALSVSADVEGSSVEVDG